MGRNEYALLGESVYNDEDRGESGGRRKLLYEIHGNGIPRPKGYGKWFEQAIGSMSSGFVPSARSARLDIVFHEVPDFRPSIMSTYNVQGSVLSEMSCKGVIMMIT